MQIIDTQKKSKSLLSNKKKLKNETIKHITAKI